MEELVTKGPIQSVSRATAILRCFLVRRELSLHEICQMVNLHKSTTSTLVTTLKNEQFLEQDAKSGKYRLGLTAFLLGANTKITLHTLAQPVLFSLQKKFGETVNLAIPDGANIVYVDKIESEYSMRTSTSIGMQLPFYCTANGKAIFSHYPSQRIKELFDLASIKKYTENTVTDYEKLQKELELSREQGFSWDNEELEVGLTCYAAPVFGGNNVPICCTGRYGI